MDQEVYVNRFTNMFTNNAWGSEESVSGPGSELAATATLRLGLANFLRDFEITSIFDAPCGDFNWMAALTSEIEVDYLGGDIVSPLIEANNAQFGNSSTRFVIHDLIEDPMPDADFVLIRDCFIHLSNRHVFDVLRKFLQSSITFIGLTTMVDLEQNTDIETGKWRLINLNAEPFSLPEPRLFIDDDKNEVRDKKIGIWHRQQLAEFANDLEARS